MSARVVALLAILSIACGAPSAGSGATSAPPATSAAAATPTPTATTTATQPAASPSLAPAAAYLDDRSAAEQVIRSYYDAIGRRQYLRAYSYWEQSSTLPTFETFQQGFADTTAVQVELGTVGGGVGAGHLYWSVPAAVFSTTSAGAKSFVGCYTVHLGRPELQAAPPFSPMAIQTGQLSAAASSAVARAGLATVCGSANATPLP